MDNFVAESTVFQLPSITDQFSLEIPDLEDEDNQQFIAPDFVGHNENLAAVLPKSTLDRISSELMEAIEEDLNSRKEWEDGLSQAIEQLGLKVDNEISFPFDNACGAYSPIMMQVINDFIATAIAELLPLEGPAKEYVVGEATDEIEDQADRIETFFNLFLTEICEEYYPDMKKMLIWVVLAGMCVRKTYFDHNLGRPTSAFIFPQDFIVNYNTTNLKTCWRMTEVQNINKMDVAKREQNGTFIRVELAPDDGGDESLLKKTLDQVEGLENASTDNKIDCTFYETHTYLDIEELQEHIMNGEENESIEDESSKYRPYRITINKKSKKVVALYRNWEENDPEFKRIDFYTDFGYVEGLGFYKFGAAHLIGGIAKASTALLRQTIDGQTLSNFPGGMRVKGMRQEDNNISMGPCEFIEIDTGGLPIRDAIMMTPYKEPSPYINGLRNELETSGARIMGSANGQMPDFNPNAPVGTTLALLEHMGLIQSTVMRGLRDSMAREFKKMYKIFSKVLPEQPYYFDRSGGQSYISRADFIDQISIIPIADPHVTTKMQRMMRAQGVIDLAKQFPGLYNEYVANKMYLKIQKFTDSEIDDLLPNKEDIMPLDPVTENGNLMTGKAVRAGVEQDHAAHLIVHEFMMQDPQMPPQVGGAIMAHIAEHKALQFQIQIQQMTGMQIPPNPEEIPPEMQNQIAMMAAQALMQQQQQSQEQAPPPPLDPAVVMLEKVKVDDKAVDQREEASKREAQTKAFEAQLDYEAKMKALELKAEEMGLKFETEMISRDTAGNVPLPEQG